MLRQRQDDAVTGLRCRRWFLLMIMLLFPAMIMSGGMDNMRIFG